MRKHGRAKTKHQNADMLRLRAAHPVRMLALRSA